MLKYRMNYLDLLPDDLIDVVYTQLHKSYMKDINTKLRKEINRRWDCLDEYDKYEIIQKWFPTEYAEFYIYEDDKLIDPRLTPYIGTYQLFELYVDEEGERYAYVSKILYNPTYGEILLECDKFLKHIGNNTHHLLKKISISSKNRYTQTYCLNVSLTETEGGFESFIFTFHFIKKNDLKFLCDYILKKKKYIMPSQSTIYRRNNPENYAKQQEAKKIKLKEKYENDPEYRLKKLEQAKIRYYRLKEAKELENNAE